MAYVPYAIDYGIRVGGLAGWSSHHHKLVTNCECLSISPLALSSFCIFPKKCISYAWHTPKLHEMGTHAVKPDLFMPI